MQFIYNDGGRSNYFKAKNVGDCVTRAIAIATGIDYLEIYKCLKELAKKESVKHHRGHKQSSVRDGVFKETWKKYLKKLEDAHKLEKIKCCEIGSRNKIHLTDDELPTNGTYIIQCAKHLTCIKDGVLYDTWDCQINEYTDEPRLVYAMWKVLA